MPGDVFERWGLNDNATDDDIHVAYRRRVQQLHPDKAGDHPAALLAFWQLQEDYKLLKNPAARQALRDARHSHPAPPPPGASGGPIPNTPPHVVDHAPASALHHELVLTLAQAWSGGRSRISIRTARPCSCAGACWQCKGTGQVFINQQLIVSFPPGANPQTPLIFPGYGHHGPTRVGPLVLHVVWKHCHGWRWDGQGLTRHMYHPNPRPFARLFLRVPSGAWGVVVLPASYHPGQTIALAQQGWKDQHGQQCRVQVMVRPSPWWRHWWDWCVQQWNILRHPPDRLR